jgi:hypothetical protein
MDDLRRDFRDVARFGGASAEIEIHDLTHETAMVDPQT